MLTSRTLHLHAHGTRFGRTAQGYGFGDDVLACVHDVGGTSSVAETMTHDRDQRSKIKSVSRDQKAEYILFHLCNRFRLKCSNLAKKYCMTTLYLVYTTQTSSGKWKESIVGCPDFPFDFPPSLLCPSYVAAASVVFVIPGICNELRRLSADNVLPAMRSTGEGDLLPIKGDLVAVSTKDDEEPGDRGARRDAEEVSQACFLLPPALSASPPPR